MSASFLPSDAADEPPVVLHVRTQRIEEFVDLLAHVPAAVSGAWLRHGQGMVALGTAWSVQAAGPHRFAA
ncbi:MAG: isochorismate synthase, partial [Brachybacterium sp.]|nr:isochorismate synthase [Brachybacterium sp.]